MENALGFPCRVICGAASRAAHRHRGGDALQHMGARLRRKKTFVAPAFGEGSGQARMVGMRDQPPSCFRFQPQHVIRLLGSRHLAILVYSVSGVRADSCQRCRKYHSRNITRKKKAKPSTVAASTSANR